LIKDTAIALFMRIVGAILWLACTVLLARLLSQSDFGLLMYVIGITVLATPLVAMGTRLALLRYASQSWGMGNLVAFRNALSQARLVVLINSTLILGLLVVAVQADINTPVSSSMFIAMITGLAIMGAALSEIQRTALRAADKMASAMFSFSIVKVLVLITGCIGLAIINRLTTSSALIVFIFSCGASLLFETQRLRYALRSKTRTQAKAAPPVQMENLSTPESTAGQRLKTALGIWPGDVSGVLIVHSGGVIAGAMFGLETAALYLAAERIALLGLFLMDAVRTAISPQIARATGSGATTFQSVLSQASLLMSIASMTAFISLIVIGWPLLLLFGENYTNAYSIFFILLVSQFSWCIFGPVNSTMLMSGLEKANSFFRIINSISGILIGLFLGTKLGVIGIALGYLIVTWINNACMNLFLRRRKIKVGIFSIRMANIKLLKARACRYLRHRKMLNLLRDATHHTPES